MPERVAAIVVGLGGRGPGGDGQVHGADLVVVQPLLGPVLRGQQHRLPLVLEYLARALLHRPVQLVVLLLGFIGHLHHPAAYRLEVFALVARLLDARDLQLGLALVLGVAVLIAGPPPGRRVVVHRVGKHLR